MTLGARLRKNASMFSPLVPPAPMSICSTVDTSGEYILPTVVSSPRPTFSSSIFLRSSSPLRFNKGFISLLGIERATLDTPAPFAPVSNILLSKPMLILF